MSVNTPHKICKIDVEFFFLSKDNQVFLNIFFSYLPQLRIVFAFQIKQGPNGRETFRASSMIDLIYVLFTWTKIKHVQYV